ncbi:type IV secretion system protein VirB10 [Paucibacter sp. PLA-PC-4]|uniref:type IV secretion system protein VirB10 n=1 Tax=Paucibacter sp. PLA-PC-4 TaxID=2993655 RepID=UPI00224AB646|nr:type IV secretion system protein VirB10 [Paucibacter sp. PLA-PC-4]MCX2864943.1 type IV secretion system protein VirB10 [Paucibacter sp. PLA-PC-4]
MTEASSHIDAQAAAQPAGSAGATFTPLPGEAGLPNVAAQPRQPVSKKGMLAVVLLVGSSVIVSALAIQRCTASAMKADEGDGKRVRNKPAAATAEPRRLDLAGAPAAEAMTPGSGAPAPRVPAVVPALVPTEEELVEPIGVRRSGSAAGNAQGVRPQLPEDAPVLLVSTRPKQGAVMGAAPAAIEARGHSDATEPDTDSPADALSDTSRNLKRYQQQLQGLLDNLTRTTELAQGAGAGGLPAVPSAGAPASTGLFGGQLLGSATPKAMARQLGHTSLILPKGSAFTCALKSRVVTASSGMVGCMVQRHVYSDDGRVLLIERGSHLDGEYRVTTVRPGMVRIPVLWTRVRTPLGVTVDIDSPATGQLGESGIDGHVDKRWGERIGAAMLLSLIDDSVKLIIQEQSQDRQGDTIVLPATTANSSKLAEKVLDSTINIAPLIYQNQGAIVGIYVARDVDFSGVYALEPTEPSRP